MGAGKWMVVLLVAGFGAGLAAGGVTTGTLRHWVDRFGGPGDDADQGLVAFDDRGDSHRSGQIGRMARPAYPQHGYSDDQGYPLEGDDEGFAQAPEPGYRDGPPGRVIIWRGSQWPDEAQGDDGDWGRDENQAYASQPRARSYAPAPQYAPQAPARPSVPQNGGDAAASAAERAAAAAADVLAAERSSH